MSQMVLLLDTEHVVDVLELLYTLPFQNESMQEPTYKRAPGVEQLIEQLQARIDDEGEQP